MAHSEHHRQSLCRKTVQRWPDKKARQLQTTNRMLCEYRWGVNVCLLGQCGMLPGPWEENHNTQSFQILVLSSFTQFASWVRSIPAAAHGRLCRSLSVK